MLPGVTIADKKFSVVVIDFAQLLQRQGSFSSNSADNSNAYQIFPEQKIDKDALLLKSQITNQASYLTKCNSTCA